MAVDHPPAVLDPQPAIFVVAFIVQPVLVDAQQGVPARLEIAKSFEFAISVFQITR